jgi:hypothetical protein
MWRRQAISVSVIACALCSNLRGERVGFKFTGALEGSSAGTYLLFGTNVPQNSPITGSFSFDTTAVGVDTEPGVRIFPQFIEGGFTLDINHGAIRLSASDYAITVADDLEREPEAADVLSVDFDARFEPLPVPILVDGVPWTSSNTLVKVELSWVPSTFTDADEPKLTPDRPLTPGSAKSGFVDGGSGPPRLFSVDSISAIAPLAGDYNRDGKLNAKDYAEWRSAFGHQDEAFRYADGNHDGVVDAADYVAFRNASAMGATVSTIPEPQSLTMAFAVVLSFAGRSLNHGGCMDRSPSRRPP